MCIKKWILGGMFLAAGAFAENPLVNYHYLADPTTLVIDSTFWIIADLDDENVDGYNIKAYYALSSKDMANWTDHGEVFRVPRDVTWAGAAWAPGAVYHNGKVYVYFPNGASGVGVVTASTPVGPYKDPVGRAIISGTSCDAIAWCFDPGVFVDDDGQAYLIWGGGNNDARPYGSNFSMVKLNSDMISWSGSILRVTGTTNSFEAPYITQRNGIYYLSFSTRSQKIDYATSSSPTGPWTYRGTVMDNPNINGQNINSYNNNHHGFAQFKGRWYAAYHDRRLAIANNDSKPEIHRSLSIDELYYNTDGTFKQLVFTHGGPAQVGNFNPYDSIPAITSSKHQNIRSRTVTVTNAPPYSLLMPKPSLNGGAWLRLSNVNFGNGATSFTVNASSLNGNNKVEIRTGSATGTLAGTCNLANTGAWTAFSTTECTVAGLSGVVPQLYIKFTGTDSTAGLRWWRFTPASANSSSSALSSSSSASSSSAAIPQAAYSSAVIPGVIQMENYDVGGEGVAYHDTDAENQGGLYRKDGVDIVGDSSDGYKIGYTVAGEWLEYTVNVADAGIYNWEARVSSGNNTSAFRLLLDTLPVIASTMVPQTGEDWDTYTVLKGTTPALPAGQHVLRLEIEGSYCNIDWLSFRSISTGLQSQSTLNMSGGIYRVYNIQGILLGEITASADFSQLQNVVKQLVKEPGIYLVRAKANHYSTKIMVPFK